METMTGTTEVDAKLRLERSDDLPDECRQMMGMVIKMSDELLSEDELQRLAQHMADCRECATVYSEINKLGDEPMGMPERGDRVTVEMKQKQ